MFCPVFNSSTAAPGLAKIKHSCRQGLFYQCTRRVFSWHCSKNTWALSVFRYTAVEKWVCVVVYQRPQRRSGLVYSKYRWRTLSSNSLFHWQEIGCFWSVTTCLFKFWWDAGSQKVIRVCYLSWSACCKGRCLFSASAEGKGHLLASAAAHCSFMVSDPHVLRDRKVFLAAGRFSWLTTISEISYSNLREICTAKSPWLKLGWDWGPGTWTGLQVGDSSGMWSANLL